MPLGSGLKADDLKVGDKLRDNWRITRDPPGGGILWHVRGFVDGHAVLRTWAKVRKRWDYEVVSGYSLALSYRRD